MSGATVTVLPARRSTSTGRTGHFAIDASVGDTLLIATVGYRPVSLLVRESVLAGPIRIEQAPSPLPLADIIVTAEGPASPTLTEGRWRLPSETARELPYAVEPDVYRSLWLVPAVGFSTVLSARPLIRGYDAGQTSLKIDGIEATHPYHIGRAFSAVPLDAVDHVSVVAAPGDPSRDGGVSGDIDVAGRSGPADSSRAGATLTLGSASAWLGGGTEAPALGVIRLASLSIANQAVPGEVFPYWFGDLYASVGSGDKARGSLFLSRDDLGDRGEGSGADWWSGLLGIRMTLARGQRGAVEATLSGSRFGLNVTNFQTSRATMDARNRFGRFTAGLDMSGTARAGGWSIGGSIGYRDVSSDVRAQGSPAYTTELNLGRVEAGLYVQAFRSWGPLRVTAGARADRAGRATIIAPRMRVGLRLSESATIALTAGRSGRLFHVLSAADARPDLDFLDLWLPAGEEGVPVPRVDHAIADFESSHGPFHARLSAYVSRGHGIGETCSSEVPTDCAFAYRFGRARTRGLEAQVALRGTEERGNAISLSYVLGFSDRDFGTGWSPWSLDRRHLVRALGQSRLRANWSVAASVEVASGTPITPVEQIGYIQGPGGNANPTPVVFFGRENALRGSGTFRLDVSSHWSLDGPWGSRLLLGASITNLNFGPIAPVELDLRALPQIRYKRTLSLPPIPSIMARFEF